MTKTEVRLAYQKVTGLSLETINNIITSPIIEDIECPECGEEFTKGVYTDSDFLAYVEWLEEKVISLAKHNQHLLDSTQPHLY